MERKRTRKRQRRVAAPAQTEINDPVGYRKPPLHTRFKKGQSGNPSGLRRERRPKKLTTAIADRLRDPVTKSRGRRRQDTKLDAIADQWVDDAVAGNHRARTSLVQEMRRDDGSTTDTAQPIITAEADKLVVEQLFVRIREIIQGQESCDR
jgi:Family of unknown function (DUF5681)